MASAYDWLQSFPDRSVPADRTVATRSDVRDSSGPGPRVTTTGTLFGVLVMAAVAVIFAPPASTTSQPPAATAPAGTPPAPAASAAPVERTSGAPVKIIGATPRSEDCEGQVWPYIEGRCLVRAAAKPRAAETTGAAPTETPAVATVPAVSDGKAEPRTATALLQLPPRRQVERLSPASDAWAGDVVEQPNEAKPRRRAGRRAYRGYGWGGRHAFPFRF
jgi:hypothetical protein